MKKKAEKIYLGLNVGTNSIGYAVTDEQYNLLKFNGNDAWGSIVFDAASSNEDRRNHRLARRNLDRRQQRIVWLQEIFAKEISKVDDRFFIRLSESFRWREDVQDQYVFFNDKEYTDVQYMKENPTIHHLICELMDNKAPHDVRLVYLACAWLIAHRGHFLNNLNVEKLDEIMDISSVYQNFINYFTENGYKRPWGEIDVSALAEALKRRSGVTAKTKELLKILLNGKKPEKSGTEEFPFSQDSIIRLLAGGQCKLKDVFCKEEYLDLGSISLDMDEDKFGEISGSIGEDYDLLMALRGLYDWSVLADLLNGHSKTISAAKVQMYEQHKEDLRVLKYFMHKYLPGKYNEVFRKAKADNYVAYTGHMDKETASQLKKKANVEDFSRYIQKLVRSINPEEKDQQTYDKCKDDVHDLMQQLESMGEYADSRLQSDRLYLYFMQFGKCAYSGAHIGFDQLMAGSVEYDIDHIYPQSYVKDDSLNNKVLVLSDLNGTKDNIYPVSPEIRGKMQGLWSWWNHVGAISDEKYKRLIRSAPFTDEEKMGFINRQLTETSQSTKFIADLLKERFPDAEVVYVKAGLVSDFRHEFDLPKSRSYNDLHNAADAFLSVVAGNVYDMRFSKKWFRIDEKYSVKVKTIFTHEVKCRGDIIWDGMPMLEKVEDTARKNTAHFVKYAAFKTGGLFDQNPVKKGTGLIPLKAGLPTEKYGGYNKAGIMFLIPVRYNIGKKSEILILPVELMHGKHFLEDKVFARNYTFTRLENILGKKVGEVSFPMGMRPWKINTMLSFDGFRVCLTGTSGRGKCLVAQPVMQFSADEHWRFYVKRLERFVEKIGINPDLLYDKDHDKVSKDENLKLYELYVDKLQNTIYKKRVNSPVQTLLKGKEEFKKLSIEEQCQVLLNIQSVFGRMTGGCDLTLIGGSAHSAATGSLSTTISNWKKKYSTVRIIDQSPSGMWEKSSENLLDFL